MSKSPRARNRNQRRLKGRQERMPDDDTRTRILIYTRVSRSNDPSPEDQATRIRQWAADHGYEEVAVVSDDIAAHVDPFRRPGLGPWLTSRASQYDGIAVCHRGDFCGREQLREVHTMLGKTQVFAIEDE